MFLSAKSKVAAAVVLLALVIAPAPLLLFPSVLDLPENLTVEQFRREYGGVGTQRYRQAIREPKGN